MTPSPQSGGPPTARVAATVLFLAGLCLSLFGCTEGDGLRDPQGKTVVVFRHGAITGDAGAFRGILDRFESENPGIRVRNEPLPSSTDEQHQLYAINLEGRSADFDVLSMDIIWVPEFARAGWIRELTHLLTGAERDEFFPGPLEAVSHNGRTWAVPWFVDAGVLYYRRDLLGKHGVAVPRTWGQLVRAAQEITAREEGIHGFLFQGKQYEGLVCNVLEFVWGNGGDILRQGRPVLDSRENREALAFMRGLINPRGVTPQLVLNDTEEQTRHLFALGRALFMRNWPYAWQTLSSPSSPLAGKVGLAPLPSFEGHESASTLGGWQLGVNRFSRHPGAAERLVRYLTSPETQRRVALEIGFKPARKPVYQDAELRGRDPSLGALYEIFLKARPRPVSPYYLMMTQVLQPEFSAVLSGIRTPEAALRSAQRQIERILEVDR